MIIIKNILEMNDEISDMSKKQKTITIRGNNIYFLIQN